MFDCLIWCFSCCKKKNVEDDYNLSTKYINLDDDIEDTTFYF